MIPKLLFKVQVLVFAVTIFPQFGRASLKVDEIRNDFFELEDALWNYVIDYSDSNTVKDPHGHLIEKFHQFNDKVQQMPQDVLLGMETARTTYDFLYIYGDMQKLHDLYEKFLEVQGKYKLSADGPIKEGFVITFAEDILNSTNSVNQTSNRIFDRIFTNDGNSIMLTLYTKIFETDFMCDNNKQTPQQVFYHLYNAISLTALKGYILTQFALLSEAIYEQEGDLIKRSLEARKTFTARTSNYIVYFRNFMSRAYNKLWRCDPKEHIEGDTYVQLTRLLQLHIENEADLNRDRSCKKTCAEYSSVNRVYGCYDSDSKYCSTRKFCSGRLLNCQEASHTSACISPSWSLRRYDYLQLGDTKWGRKDGCSGTLAPSWTRWFVYCSACRCLCDEPGSKSDRYFSLLPSKANTTNNRVVTGIRLTKQNRIIHLQIQEGQLLPYGYINQSTVEWVPVRDYRITDWDVRQGQDYHQMSFEDRKMSLDQLYSHEDDHIVTGVGFIYEGGYLKLNVEVSHFDFKTGKLYNRHEISGNDFRSKIDLHDAGIPLQYHNTDPNFDMAKFEFTHTSFVKDAGQTTIPFIDSQPAVTSPAGPIKGVGIYWRGRSGSGGFVAPIITGYDFEQKMGIVLPEPPLREARKLDPVLVS